MQTRLEAAKRSRTRTLLEQNPHLCAEIVARHYTMLAQTAMQLRECVSARKSGVQGMEDAMSHYLARLHQAFVEDFGVDPPWAIQLAAEVEKVNKLQDELAAQREKVDGLVWAQAELAESTKQLAAVADLRDELREQLDAERESRFKTELACEQWIRQCELLQETLSGVKTLLRELLPLMPDWSMRDLKVRVQNVLRTTLLGSEQLPRKEDE